MNERCAMNGSGPWFGAKYGMDWLASAGTGAKSVAAVPGWPAGSTNEAEWAALEVGDPHARGVMTTQWHGGGETPDTSGLVPTADYAWNRRHKFSTGCARGASLKADDPGVPVQSDQPMISVVTVACASPSVDCGPEIQAAMDSGAHTVIVPPATEGPAAPIQINATLYLRSNQTLVLQPGVVLQAARGGHQAVASPMFSSVDPARPLLRPRLFNSTVLGFGASLTMRQADYNDPLLYNKSEDRAGIMLDDAHHVAITGLHISLTGGDGITVNGYEPASSDIYLADLVLDRCYRNALSIISVENMTLERCVLSRTGQVYGTRPMSA